MIISISQGQDISKRYKKINKKIGLCHGCFDVFHFGHINYLKKAKSLCDILFVSVSPNRFVKKGKNRPIFSCQKRLMVLEAVKYIDYVFSNAERTARDSIKKIKPDFYFKGGDYLKKASKNYSLFQAEKKYVNQNKGKTVLITEPSFSSTKILKKIGI